MNPWTIPNGLTLIRFLIGGFLIAYAYLVSKHDLANFQVWALSLAGFAFATDWFDGWIARTWPSQKSKLGEYTDPPADKLAVVAYMYVLYELDTVGLYEYICFTAIILREVGMMAWRWLGGAYVLPVNKLGKFKTGFQMVALVLYGLVPIAPVPYELALVVLTIASVLTLWSLAVYVLQPKAKVAS